MMYYSSLVANAVFGHDSKFSFFKPPSFNNFLMKMAYRRHNLHVIQNAPKDKLLIYNVKEGWKPLCEFLGVEVPDVPFPRKNVGGSIVDEWLERPAIKKMKLEILCSMTAIVTVSSYLGYKLVYGGWGNGIWSTCLRIFD
uniref:Sulfotransferase n=1 Tax=Ciona savignyi TaxID=51511 RepID=H2ZG74_CIOSA